MTVDLTNLPWDDLKPHSLVVTRLTDERLDRFIYVLRDKVGDSVRVAPMHPDTEVFVISEQDMNSMGWVRKTA